jgi:hypothetical protein
VLELLLCAGTDLWCELHKPFQLPRGAIQARTYCQVACRSNPGESWQACEGQRQEGFCFCSQHLHMDRRCGPAAAVERQGLQTSWRPTRHDRKFQKADVSSGDDGGADGGQAGPDTPGRGAAAAGVCLASAAEKDARRMLMQVLQHACCCSTDMWRLACLGHSELHDASLLLAGVPAHGSRC